MLVLPWTEGVSPAHVAENAGAIRFDNVGSLWSFCYGRAGNDAARRLLTLLRSRAMSFKDLMDSWGNQRDPLLTRKEYSVNLPLNDASRLHALAELYPAVPIERLITDLISEALDEIETAMPYAAGDRVIREDDHGDPVYEDVGMTPRFLELVRQKRQNIESGDA
jgi:hypothetical protein